MILDREVDGLLDLFSTSTLTLSHLITPLLRNSDGTNFFFFFYDTVHGRSLSYLDTTTKLSLHFTSLHAREE